ncbi:MAG: hypothetical protein AAF217_04665 [Pseudomonadota bacterium]
MAKSKKKTEKSKISIPKSLKKKKKGALKNKSKPENVTAPELDEHGSSNRTDIASWQDVRGRASDHKPVSFANDDVQVRKQKPVAQGKNEVTNMQEQNTSLFTHAFGILIAATLIALMMVALVFILPDGKAALLANSGFPGGDYSLRTLQSALFLDTLFPIAYGAGFAVLTAAHKNRGNRSLVRMILAGILVVIVTDLAENSIIYSSSISATPLTQLLPVLTMIKFVTLAAVGVILSAILIPAGGLSVLSFFLLRFAFPFGTALLVSGLYADMVQAAVGISVPLVLLVLALYARHHAKQSS